ncbi:MAG: flagellar filament capping protein FliD [Proteobacteria bacterium]|nr:flagellar filament capping protein FliD [Pseudomonadota bacterium]
MATISSLGVGSGLDVNSIITQLMAIEKKPLTNLQTAGSKIQTQISEVGKIKSAVSTLNDAAAKLASSDFWKTTTGSSSSNAVSITTSSSASAADYSVQVTSLAKAQTIAAPAVASSTATLGAGTLTIQRAASGSTPVTVTIDASDTLAAIRDKINSSGAGVTASILNDGSGARLMMRSNSTGLANAFSTTVSGTGLDGLAFDAGSASGGATLSQAAADAAATINNLPITSASNTLADVLDGVTLTLNAETIDPVTVSVTSDTDALKKKINDFASAYSALAALIKTDTKYDATSKTAGVLQGDSSIVGVQNQLRSLLGSTSGASGTYARLSDIGLELQQDGSLTVNSTKLDKALANLPEITKLFSNSNLTDASLDGFGKRFRTLTSSMIGIDGGLSSRSQALSDKLKRNQDDQDRMQTRLDQTQKRLEKQYGALDKQMASLNSLSSYVAQQVTVWNKSG